VCEGQNDVVEYILSQDKQQLDAQDGDGIYLQSSILCNDNNLDLDFDSDFNLEKALMIIDRDKNCVVLCCGCVVKETPLFIELQAEDTSPL
jgi:hypothetical protein